MHKGLPTLARAVLGIAMVSLPAAGDEMLYRWIDEEGLPHFSDRPPPAQARMPEQLSMPAYAAPALAPDEDPYSVLNQARRLESSRLNLERQRQEQQQRDREYDLQRRELEAYWKPQGPAAPAAVYAYPRPGPWHPGPSFHQPTWPSHRPRPPSLWEPDHPAYGPYPRPRAAHPPRVYARDGMVPRR